MASMLSGAFAWFAEVDAKEPAAVAEIRSLGGIVGPISEDNDHWHVQFHLSGRELTDDDLVHVTGLGSVASLNLSNTRITSAGLVHIKDLVDLRILHLERTKIGDDGIGHLANLAKLEYLNLYSTQVTDVALQKLARLKKLKHLFVWQTGVTDEGVSKLQKALPACHIVRGVDFSKLPAPPPPKPVTVLKWTAGVEGLPDRSKTGASASVVFENNTNRQVKLFWIAYNGERKQYAEINSGASHQQNTYSEAYWLITDEKNMPLGYFKALPDDCKAVIPKS